MKTFDGILNQAEFSSSYNEFQYICLGLGLYNQQPLEYFISMLPHDIMLRIDNMLSLLLFLSECHYFT